MAKKDNTVKSFILRVDADMMEAIEAWAADEFRSTNGQIPVHSGPSLSKGRTVEEEKTAPATKRRQVIKKSLIFRSGFFING